MYYIPGSNPSALSLSTLRRPIYTRPSRPVLPPAPSSMTASTATTSSMRWKTTAFRSAWARAITMCSASTRTCGRVWREDPAALPGVRRRGHGRVPGLAAERDGRLGTGDARHGVTISTLSDEAKAEWAETALGYQDTLQTWIDEVTALGYDGAGIMSAYLQAGEELGYEWHFDTTPYIQ